jgi:membrane protein
VLDLRGGYRLLADTVAKWSEDRAPRLAAALAYYAAFSFAPILLIAIGLAGVVFGEEQAREQILRQASSILGAQSAASLESLMGARGSAASSGAISAVIGFVTLLLGAVGVLAQLKDALNVVWRVTLPKTTWLQWARRYFADVALVVATGLMLLISLVATAVLGMATQAARSWVPGPDAVWWMLDVVAGLAMTTGVFALVFRVIPDTDVRWGDALAGGLLTAVLFTAGRLGLAMYLGRSAGESAYEATGSVLALLLWVYYSAQLVLLGAEFTYVYSRRHEPAKN